MKPEKTEEKPMAHEERRYNLCIHVIIIIIIIIIISLHGAESFLRS